MKFISMKNKSKKTLRAAKMSAEAPMMDEPAYPWGLELTLGDESIKKLKLDVENLSAGDEVYFMAKAKITRLSVNEHLNLETNKMGDNSDIGLQITEMAWGKPGKDF